MESKGKGYKLPSEDRTHCPCGFILLTIMLYYIILGARGVVVIVVGNGHGDTSSNPGRD